MKGDGGKPCGAHFLLELLTGSVTLRLKDSDPTVHYQLFTRILFHNVFQEWEDFAGPILAACTMTKEMAGRWHTELTQLRECRVLQTYVPTRPHDSDSDLRLANIVEDFLKQVCSSKASADAFSLPGETTLPSKMRVQIAPPLASRHAGSSSARHYSVGRITLTPVENEELPDAELPLGELYACGDQPLAWHLPLADIVVHGQADGDNILDTHVMPCAHPALLEHPQAQSELARDTLKRLGDDWGCYAEQHNAETLSGLAEAYHSVEALEGLQCTLQEHLGKDCAAMCAATRAVLVHVQLVGGSNEIEREEERLLQYIGLAPRANWASLVASLLSSTGAEEIRQSNRYLSDVDVELALRTTAGIMLRTCRIEHLRRAIRAVQSTIQAMADTSGMAEQRVLTVRNEVASLTDQLEARRHYVTAELQLDPRMLAFEYLFGWLLRKGQVELIATLHERASGADGYARNGVPCASMAHQMIMGGGKSTCISPMLALLLADGHSLVTQVVPTALLSMSREVMWSRFAQVIVKTVHTLNFSRAPDPATGCFIVDPSLFSKLDEARRNGGVVITTPVAIKSLVNKFVELLHTLREEEHRLFSKHPSARETKVAARLRGTLDPLHQGSDGDIMRQANALAQIIELWGARESGVLLIDELDLLLHPLRSELNFPIGARDHPLSPEPTRRELPIYLLDRLLVALDALSTDVLWREGGARDVPPQSGSGTPKRDASTCQLTAVDLALCACISEGLAANQLLGQPHLVVVDRPFYKARMMPLLAQMASEYLVDAGVFETKTPPPAEVLLEYLLSGMHASEATLKAVKAAGGHAVQGLNHAHELLTGTLPHMLSRVHRVAFGVLRPEEMQPDEPELRRLMAIPFVGKDRPSPAAEFAQPDVMICATVLGYFYEGLRYSDVQHMARQMSQELRVSRRPPADHPHHVVFEGWVRGAMAAQQLTERPVVTLALFLTSERAQMEALHSLLRHYRPAITHYVRTHVLTATNLQGQRLKISSSGQELGGDILFGRRLGFSGTPSNLLPHDLYPCQFEEGSEGRILHTLTDPRVTTMCRLDEDGDQYGGVGSKEEQERQGKDGAPGDGNTTEAAHGVGSGGGAGYARWLLGRIAAVEPPYDALIDAGARRFGIDASLRPAGPP